MLHCSFYPVVGIIGFLWLIRARSASDQMERYHTEHACQPLDRLP
jgi:hypothetical protein